MRRKTFTRLLFAASVAALLPIGAVNAEPLQSAQLEARIGNKGFEFRGRMVVWKFAPDGKVSADYNTYRATQGAMGEQWGLKAAGTWRREGDKLCVKWEDARSDECFTVTRGEGRTVTLAGPRMIEGTLDAVDETGYAETPRPAAPATPPGYRYQRVPGAR